jgi:N-acetylmuramoyl-L-alanine amidase
LRRFRSTFLSLLFLMLFLVPQVGMAALNDNRPGAKPAAAITSLKATALSQTKLSGNNQLINVRWLVHKDAVEGTSKLRLVIDTKDAVRVSSKLDGTNGSQLVIDINGAAVGNVNNLVDLDGKIADKVRFIKKDNTNSQVIVDLSTMIEDSDYKVFTLKSDAINNKTFRVVIDVNQVVPKVEYNFTAGLRNKVIAIDPGHGGSDPGAIGPNKLQEKTVTLAVAQKVQALLEKAGAKVLMTRKTDVDVFGPNASAVDELNARTLGANNNKADVFVSLHINAFTSPSVGGTATYYYQKSNYDILLANCIQDNLVKTGGLQDRGINAAGFYVIKKTKMPSVLAELGFISNPDEEKLLSTPQFQQKLAQGIVQGLDDFFAQAAKKGGGL